MKDLYHISGFIITWILLLLVIWLCCSCTITTEVVLTDEVKEVLKKPINVSLTQLPTTVITTFTNKMTHDDLLANVRFYEKTKGQGSYMRDFIKPFMGKVLPEVHALFKGDMNQNDIIDKEEEKMYYSEIIWPKNVE